MDKITINASKGTYDFGAQKNIPFDQLPKQGLAWNVKERWIINAIWNGPGDRLASSIKGEADLLFPGMKTRFE